MIYLLHLKEKFLKVLTVRSQAKSSYGSRRRREKYHFETYPECLPLQRATVLPILFLMSIVLLFTLFALKPR